MTIRQTMVGQSNKYEIKTVLVPQAEEEETQSDQQALIFFIQGEKYFIPLIKTLNISTLPYLNLLSYPLNPSPSPFSRTRHTCTSPTTGAHREGVSSKGFNTSEQFPRSAQSRRPKTNPLVIFHIPHQHIQIPHRV